MKSFLCAVPLVALGVLSGTVASGADEAAPAANRGQAPALIIGVGAGGAQVVGVVEIRAQAANNDAAAEARPAPAKPAKAAAAVAKPAAKPVQKPKAAAAAFDAAALAAPLVEPLQGKLELNGVDDANNPQIQQWIVQFTQQYRPLLSAELNFIRQTCELKPADRPKVKAAGEAGLKEAVRKSAELQVPMAGGIRATAPDPRRVIRDALSNGLKQVLTDEQLAAYTEESMKRSARRKRAAIMNLVARLDSTMCLTPQQRSKITESVSAGWQEKWEQWLNLSIYGEQYLPSMPENLVTAHLDADQIAVWNGVQKVDFGFWNAGGQPEQNDGWWGDAPDAEARPAAAIGIDFIVPLAE